MTRRPDKDDPIWKLANDALAGPLDDDAQEQLAELLSDSALARQLYTDACLLHTDLHLSRVSDQTIEFARHLVEQENGVVEQQEGAQSSNIESVSPAAARGVWTAVYDVVSNYITLSLLISAIVMAIIVLSMGLIVPESSPVRPDVPAIEFVAEISNTYQSSWHEGSRGNLKNRSLMSGDLLLLRSGFAEITFKDGAVVVLEGPSELTIDSAGAGSLGIGKLFARVPQPAVGFTITTPTSEIVDFGTEFGVTVDPKGNSYTQVIEGSVEVRRRTTDGTPPKVAVRLRRGDAVRARVGEAGLSSLPATNSFVRALPQRGATSKTIPVTPLNKEGLVTFDFTNGRGKALGDKEIGSFPGDNLENLSESNFTLTDAKQGTGLTVTIKPGRQFDRVGDLGISDNNGGREWVAGEGDTLSLKFNQDIWLQTIYVAAGVRERMLGAQPILGSGDKETILSAQQVTVFQRELHPIDWSNDPTNRLLRAGETLLLTYPAIGDTAPEDSIGWVGGITVRVMPTVGSVGIPDSETNNRAEAPE